MAGEFRSRLYHIKNEKELFKYFTENARFVDEGVYACAGIYANDTGVLFEKLKKEWTKDIKLRAKQLLKVN